MQPGDWDFYDEKTYQLRVVNEDAPIYLFNAATDAEELMKPWVRNSHLVPSQKPGVAEYVLDLESIPTINPASNAGKEEHDYSMRYFFRHKAAGRWEDVASKKKLVLQGRSLNEQKIPIQLALMMKDGAAFGGTVTLIPEEKEYALSMESLQQVKWVNLPRPYPDFLPYYFENKTSTGLDLDAVESIQISVGPGIPDNQLNQPYSLAIESIRLE